MIIQAKDDPEQPHTRRQDQRNSHRGKALPRPSCDVTAYLLRIKRHCERISDDKEAFGEWHGQ